MGITLGSLFDGIGGALLCARMCGATPVWASEIEPFPIKVTKHHFPAVRHYGDITKINGAEVEPVDIIVGGSPCQDLSVAGKRAGLDGARSGLFMEQVRIVREMRDATNGLFPRFVVWENVPGAFSSNGGEDFRAVIEEFCKLADPSVSIPRSANGWANSGSVLGDGFSLSWRTIDAQYWGVPQRRRRIYLVLDLGGQSSPQILFERDCLPWHTQTGEHKGQGTAGNASDRVGAPNNRVVAFAQNQREEVRDLGDKSTSLEAEKGTHQQTFLAQLSSVKCFNPDHPQSARIYDPSGVWHSLNANEGGGQARDAVFEWHNQDSRISGPIDVACTLNTNADGREGHLVASTYQQISGCLTPGAHPGSYNGQDAYNDMLVAHKTVRRLTPLECERLQGYPDGWTDIPGASDSARYKALGNSFAIPCALFVISGCVAMLKANQKGEVA